MKTSLKKIKDSIEKLDGRNKSYTLSKHPLLGILRNLHTDFLTEKDNLSTYCRCGLLKFGTWRVNARNAGDKIEWTLILNSGKRGGVKTCTFIGNNPAQSKRSTLRKSLTNTRRSIPTRARKHVPRPQLPTKDRERMRHIRIVAAAAYFADMDY